MAGNEGVGPRTPLPLLGPGHPVIIAARGRGRGWLLTESGQNCGLEKFQGQLSATLQSPLQCPTLPVGCGPWDGRRTCVFKAEMNLCPATQREKAAENANRGNQRNIFAGGVGGGWGAEKAV